MAPTYGFCCSEAIELAPADLGKVMEGIKATGATYARMDVPWSLIEPTLGKFSFTGLPQAVAAAVGVGLKPLLVLNGPKPQSGFWFFAGDAAWATAAEFGNFCAAVVRAFPKVEDYEIWNEPNLLSFFRPVSPIAFAPYLKAGYTAAKKANPAATFAMGGLAATVDYTGFIYSLSPFLFGTMAVTAQPSHYLAGLYGAGCKGFFDAVAYHPYVGNPATFVPMEPLVTHPSITEFANLRAVMLKNGDEIMEIWPTEWGYSVGTATDQVSAQIQAQWLVEQLRSMVSIPATSHSCPFCYRNMSAGTDANSNFGVVAYDYTPKPALAALTSALKGA
jgi:polysaccharide biosynthesis protein PslG